MILESHMTLTGNQARAIIQTYGIEYVCFDGDWPEEVNSDSITRDIEDADTFTVLVDYTNNVRLLCEQSDPDPKVPNRVDITLKGLTGQCGELVIDGRRTEARWHAIAEIEHPA